MLARDQNLLLQPAVSPAVGLRHLNRCVQMAQAWQKLGGDATLIHGNLPGLLASQMTGLPFELQHRDSFGLSDSNVDDRTSIDSRFNSGWVVVDGTEGQSWSEQLKIRETESDERWKLVAMDEWTEANASQHGNADLLIVPDASDERSGDFRTGSLLRGDRYRIPLTDSPLGIAGFETSAVPSVARKVLIWLSENDSVVALVSALADVIDVASVRTSIDVIASVERRDAAEIVQLKKANPQVTLRFWGSVERRLQSMAPIQLAIVDSRKNAQTLAVRGVPVFQSMRDGDDAGLSCVSEFRSASPIENELAELPLEEPSRAAFRRSLSRLIRDRDQRQDLARSGVENCDDQAAERIARRLASDCLQLETATMDDWSDVCHWRCDPESRASALRRSDRESERSEFSKALNRPSSSRWMLRSPSGKAIGFASLDQLEPANSSQICVQVLIKPTCRNQGYGTALLERVIERISKEEISAEQNAVQLVVQAKASHRAAHHMARKAGMTPVAPAVVDGVVAQQFGIELKRMAQTVSNGRLLKKSA